MDIGHNKEARRRNTGLQRALGSAALLFLWLLLGAGQATEAAEVDLQLDPLTNPEVAAALSASLNRASLASARAQSASMAPEDQASAVAFERVRLTAMLHEFGYLEATVELSRGAVAAGVASEDGVAAHIADSVVLRPIPGPLFTIGTIVILGMEGIDTETAEDIGLAVGGVSGAVAHEGNLVRLEGEIVWRLRNASRPFAEVARREVLPDRETGTALVRIWVEPGPAARYGAVTFVGLQHDGERTALGGLPLVRGEPYRLEAIDAFRQQLAEDLGVQSIRTELGLPDDAGEIAIEFDVVTPVPLEELRRTGLPGTIATVLALAALAVGQLFRAGDMTLLQRLPEFRAGVVLLICFAAFLGAQRVLVLAGVI